MRSLVSFCCCSGDSASCAPLEIVGVCHDCIFEEGIDLGSWFAVSRHCLVAGLDDRRMETKETNHEPIMEEDPSPETVPSNAKRESNRERNEREYVALTSRCTPLNECADCV